MSVFAPLVGQEQAVELLTQAVKRQRIAPAYLFTGPPGIGRGLAARCFIELLFQDHTSPVPGIPSGDHTPLQRRIHQGNHPDLLWVEPTYLHQGKRLSAQEANEAGLKRKTPPQIRLEQIREISQFLARPPLEASRSVVVLEQAETMAEATANGLLKTLEEPGKATLILIAPTLDSLLPTLISRCQRIPFIRLDRTGMSRVLGKLGYGEIIAVTEIMAMAQGSPGEAIRYWQQLQQMPAELLEKIRKPVTTLTQALKLAKEISQTLEPESQLWLIDYWQHRDWQQQYQSGYFQRERSQIWEKARRHLLSYVQPRLVWEVTLMAIATG